MAISSDGKTIACGRGLGFDKSLRLLHTKICEYIVQLLENNGDIRSLMFTTDGKTLASGSSDGSILLWDDTMTKTGK